MPKQTTDAPQSAPAMEAIPEPVVEEAAIAEPEPAVEEAAIPQPVQVNEPEPVSEPGSVPESVKEALQAPAGSSDPNRQLSADEIAALFAGANAGVGESKSDPAEKAVTEPAETRASEEAKSPVVDLNNTNRNLTPDEIAALFSSM